MTLSMLPFAGSGTEWNELIAGLPGAHLLQTWEWAQVKCAFGWQALPFVWQEQHDASSAAVGGLVAAPAAAAMVLRRPILRRGFARRICILYVPKGPLMDWGNAVIRRQVLDDLEALAGKQGAVLLKIDPDLELGTGYPAEDGASDNPSAQTVLDDLRLRRWRFSGNQVQFRNTVVIELAPAEDELLGSMKQKTRYNIRLAEKKGVTVRSGTLTEIPALYRMYAETSQRDGFVIRPAEYYRKVWETFLRPLETHSQPSADVLIAEVGTEPIAAIFLFYFGRRAYYLYGMSVAAHREKMSNYLLQWEAMRRAKRNGCAHYDLWGAPNDLQEDDPLWGVYRFKKGLGGAVVRTAGAWDYPASALLYPLYTRLLPWLLDIMRRRGRRRLSQSLEAG